MKHFWLVNRGFIMWEWSLRPYGHAKTLFFLVLVQPAVSPTDEFGAIIYTRRWKISEQHRVTLAPEDVGSLISCTLSYGGMPRYGLVTATIFSHCQIMSEYLLHSFADPCQQWWSLKVDWYYMGWKRSVKSYEASGDIRKWQWIASTYFGKPLILKVTAHLSTVFKVRLHSFLPLSFLPLSVFTLSVCMVETFFLIWKRIELICT